MKVVATYHQLGLGTMRVPVLRHHRSSEKIAKTIRVDQSNASPLGRPAEQ